MLAQTRESDLELFVRLSRRTDITSPEAAPMTILVPAFVTSELKTAFQIGFMIFIPFLIIDMVVASVLMAMGMMMLSPLIISLPFKIMLFVLVDGWGLIGLVVAMFQAATQINEQTLSFLPRLLVMLLTLIWAGPWLVRELMEYTQNLVQNIPLLIG